MKYIINEIQQRLTSLKPSILKIKDNSTLHKGHNGNMGGEHYTIIIVSDALYRPTTHQKTSLNSYSSR